MKVLRRIIIVIIFILLTLCSSCTDASIGKRAIVKAIYIDFANNEYEAAIVVLNYEPTSQIAEIKESAEVYSAKDKSLEKALANAEALQNKTPFYAQNELLILSTGAAQSFNEAISFFSSEDASRQEMSVYITTKSADDLKDAKELLPEIINQCENEDNINRKIFEIQRSKAGYADVIPMLEFGADNTDFIGVNTFVCVNNNSIEFEIEKDMVQYVSLLQGKADKIDETDIAKDKLTFKADDVYLTYEIINSAKPKLIVGIKGNIRSLSAGGKAPQHKSFATQYEAEINNYINKSCQSVINQFNSKKIDVFCFKWHFDMYNKKQSDINFLSNTALIAKRIIILSDLKII